MRSSLYWDVTQRKFVVADVSGQPIGPNFKFQAVPVFFGCPETSVTTNAISVTSQYSDDLSK
jgi:hypothetical protein